MHHADNTDDMRRAERIRALESELRQARDRILELEVLTNELSCYAQSYRALFYDSRQYYTYSFFVPCHSQYCSLIILYPIVQMIVSIIGQRIKLLFSFP